MKYLLYLYFLCPLFSPCMSKQPKKIKIGQHILNKLWKVQDFERAVKENKVLLVDDYLETYKPSPKSLNSALHQALEANATGSVALLLTYGVSPNMPDKQGELPLIKMIKCANVPMIIWLKAMYADAEKDNFEKKDAKEIAHELFNAAPANSPLEELCKTMLVEVSTTTLLTGMRRYMITIPEQLWEAEDITMTDAS